MVDSQLPVPVAGSGAQTIYDNQVAACVSAGDDTGLARLKGIISGLPMAAERKPDDLRTVTIAFPAAGATGGTLYLGDGTNEVVDVGVQSVEHTYPSAGFWAVVLDTGTQLGVCIVETGDPPVIPGRRGKRD